MVQALPSSEIWTSQAWYDDAVGWIDARLAAVGRRRAGAAEQVRVRPWSTLLRAPVAPGRANGTVVWFKACTDGSAYEAGLVQVLARLAPGSVPTPIAVDTDRGWLLLEDGGPVFRDAVPAEQLGDAWLPILRSYARLQRELSAHLPALLATGVPLHGPAELPDVLRQLLAEHGPPPDVPDRDLRRILTMIDAAAARLAASPVPMSLQHDDFHTGNVFAGPDGRGVPVIFDWGDAQVGHPFASMLVVARSLSHQHQVATEPDERRRLCEVYLEAWADLGSPEELYAQLLDAVLLGRVSRAASWARALGRATGEELAEWGEGILGWLADLAEVAARTSDPAAPIDVDPF